MDRQTKTTILSDAIDRAYVKLDTFKGDEMVTPEFRTLLKNIGDMEWMLNSYPLESEAPIPPAEPDKPVPKTPESEPEKPTEPAPAPPPSPAPDASMSKEELREQVAALANKHPSLDAFSLMQEMGYSKLSDIPAERRAEYLKKVKAAVEVD